MRARITAPKAQKTAKAETARVRNTPKDTPTARDTRPVARAAIEARSVGSASNKGTIRALRQAAWAGLGTAWALR